MNDPVAAPNRTPKMAMAVDIATSGSTELHIADDGPVGRVGVVHPETSLAGQGGGGTVPAVPDNTTTPSGVERSEPSEPVDAPEPTRLELWYRWAVAKQVRWSRVVPVIIVCLLALGTRVDSGFATYAPGPVPEADVSEVAAGEPSAGEWRFTTVEVAPVSLSRYLWGLLADDTMIRVSGPQGDDLTRRGAAQMQLSQEVAWAVSSDLAAGGDGRVDARVVVTGVNDGSPAAHAGVRDGDVIAAVDGTVVTTSDDVPGLIDATTSTVTLSLERGGENVEVQVTPRRDDGKARLGIALADRPAKLGERPRIRTEGVGGPSAGLVFTLAYLDSLTEGDLTGGMRVTGTGTIEADGSVGRIDGITLKVEGAISAGASVFLSPIANAEEATSAAAGRVEVVPVEKVADALKWLCSHGGESPACPKG